MVCETKLWHKVYSGPEGQIHDLHKVSPKILMDAGWADHKWKVGLCDNEHQRPHMEKTLADVESGEIPLIGGALPYAGVHPDKLLIDENEQLRLLLTEKEAELARNQERLKRAVEGQEDKDRRSDAEKKKGKPHPDIQVAVPKETPAAEPKSPPSVSDSTEL